MAVIASVVLFNVYQQNRPQVPTEVSNLPFPTSMSLPGGLNFNLGKGSCRMVNGIRADLNGCREPKFAAGWLFRGAVNWRR
jgi:hypothetical protein